MQQQEQPQLQFGQVSAVALVQVFELSHQSSLLLVEICKNQLHEWSRHRQSREFFDEVD
ncbi:hypothetical protein [Moraxella lacunata]|uniref:hypothetical protein n=1 Tax=Moraxella lacunata TaxID=477 RepID=UPI003EE0AC25